MNANERERLAVLESRVDTMERTLDEVLKNVKETNAMLNQAKGAKWMLFAALPLAGSVGAWLQSYFGSGGPTPH